MIPSRAKALASNVRLCIVDTRPTQYHSRIKIRIVIQFIYYESFVISHTTSHKYDYVLWPRRKAKKNKLGYVL